MSDSFDTNVSHFFRHTSGPGEQSLRLLVFSHQLSNMESWATGSRFTVHIPFAEKQHKPPNTTQWHPQFNSSDPRWQPLHCLQSRAQMLDLAEHPSFRPFICLSMPMSIPSSGTGGSQWLPWQIPYRYLRSRGPRQKPGGNPHVLFRLVGNCSHPHSYPMTSCTSGFDDDARIPRQVYVNGLQSLKELVAPTPFPASTVLPSGPDMSPNVGVCRPLPPHSTTPHPHTL